MEFVMTLAQLGLVLGFLGAVLQAANYAFAKDCQERFSLTGVRLLLAMHVFMGLVMLVPFMLFRHWQYLNLQTLLKLLAFVVPYLLGQYFCYRAIALSDSSIVSPLLSLKIPLLALMAFVLESQHFSALQLLSIVLIMALGCFSSALSGRVRPGPLFCVLICCSCYAYSNFQLAAFMQHLGQECGVNSRYEQILISTTCEFVCCLLPALLLCCWRALKLQPRHVWQAKWTGSAWLLSMFGIISCFNFTGVVEGNVVQSLRGVIGVLIAYIFYRSYIHDPGTFNKKLFIAAGMFAAVVLYYVPVEL